MASLAVLAKRAGARVAGCDSSEVFPTDSQLSQAGIAWQTWAEASLPSDIDYVVYSSAYAPDSQPLLREAVDAGKPIYSYPAFLGMVSQNAECYGVAGTHGKTTSVGCASFILEPTGLPFFSLYGSFLQNQPPQPGLPGDAVGILEACEYQDHFLLYNLKGLLVTNIEFDHPDYFPDIEAVHASFQKLVAKLPQHGFLICGTDSEKSKALAVWTGAARPDLLVVTYGTGRGNHFRLHDLEQAVGESTFRVDPLEGYFSTRLAGGPLCLDILGASILSACIVLSQVGALDLNTLESDPVLPALLHQGSHFPGCTGRMEILAEESGVLFVDDYAHHPTEITVTMESARNRFPGRRLVVVFCPHTRSRTESLFDGFVNALSLAEVLVVQEVYASARKDGQSDTLPSISERLAAEAGGLFAPDEKTVLSILREVLQEDDLCITMGAGNNRGLSAVAANQRRSDAC
jgi:UDP-N-acetylmuramate--alanine ligase